jgi:hypothetical protein
MVFQASETEASSFSIMLCNSARQMSSEYWNSHCDSFQPLEMEPPLRGPPINWGPVRYAPCFFLIFTGKLKHREAVTHCELPFRPPI